MCIKEDTGTTKKKTGIGSVKVEGVTVGNTTLSESEDRAEELSRGRGVLFEQVESGED